MTVSTLCQLAVATVAFVAAAGLAKGWALNPGMAGALATLALYTGGNILMLNLVRQLGMAVAFSLSAVLQLVAVNALAVFWYGETLSGPQGVGIVLAILAVALVTLGPLWSR
jgi:multidrug transporter EmrE-like cation transporter